MFGGEERMRDRADAKAGVRRISFFLLLLLAVMAGVFFAGMVFWQKKEMPGQTLEETSEIFTKEIVIETDPPVEETKAPYVSPIDFEALWETNPDTVGWIRIPDTVIDYPIVQRPKDNEFYLHTDFDGNASVHGAIYLDSDSEPDFSGWNHPIYGHHMKDGSMFKGITKFKDEDYFKSHQYFEIYTPKRTIHLKAVACYYSSADGIVRKTKFSSQQSFDEWMAERLAPCSFAEIPVPSVKSLFVLVTCSYETENARTLLFAAEVDEKGQFLSSDEEITNDNFKKP